MRFVVFALPALLSVLLQACGGKQVPQAELDRRPPLTPSPSFSLDGTPYVLEFEQGVYRDYDLLKYARVERGAPVVSVRNLPDGATFDGRMLGWTPPCGKDPEFYRRGFGIHSIMLVLRSDDGSEHFIERDAGLLVHEFRDFDGTRECGEKAP